jgi:glutathione S-transferase
MPIIVHHLNNSRSQRVLWLLEELGLDYEINKYERDAQTRLAPPELKKIHPLGKSPVVEIDGLILAETGAIIDHIIDTVGQGRLKPTANTPERIRYNFWLHYAEGSAMPPLLLSLVLSTMEQRAPALLKPLVKGVTGKAKQGFVSPQIKLHADYWESELAKADHFAGPDFTAADIMMSFPAEAATARANALTTRPKLKAWLERMHARPAYQRALERGGPYALMG